MRADLDAAFNAGELNRISEFVLAFHGLAVMLLDGIVDQSIVPLLRVASVRPRSEAALPRILRRLIAVYFASSLNVGSEEPTASLGRWRARSAAWRLDIGIATVAHDDGSARPFTILASPNV
jgi:hypothetical protein